MLQKHWRLPLDSKTIMKANAYEGKIYMVSVITINLNNIAGLQKTITSVVSQTGSEFEYIIIDGGSTDGSKELIQKNALHFTYWVSEPDKGIYNAMNKGIKAARGEYLIFLNSGDVFFASDTLAECMRSFNDEDIIYGNVLNIKPDGKQWIHSSPSKLSIYFLGYCWNSLPHQGMFTKKALFQKYGEYDESLKMVSDWAFYLLAIFVHNCTYKHIDKTIARYDFSGFSADIHNEPLQKAERELVIQKYFRNHLYLIQELADLRAQVLRYEQSVVVKLLRKLKIMF
jgi:glycosyltransferase involved in cell wall biosynthesis